MQFFQIGFVEAVWNVHLMNDKHGTGFSLKDHLFNEEKVQYLANLFSAADEKFAARAFVRDVMKHLLQLELKARIVHIATVLERYLATDFRVAAKQIVAVLPEPLDPALTDDDFGDFIFAPLGEFVVRNGLAIKHLPTSLKTLKEITQRFSMEDAIRTFINTHPDETLAELARWSTDRNYHVRRLVSEGTRPMLPWSGRISIDVTKPLPFLETLHADPTRYVTRSVANHLNDIAKAQPEIVLDALRRWKQLGKQHSSELQWMTKRALRTLVKRGHSEALQLLGFSAIPKIALTEFEINTPQIRPGDAFEFSFNVRARQNESLVIDYVVEFVKANGTLAPKVHKLKQLSLKKGESAVVSKRHVLRANATTYSLYPGTHYVTLQINGKSFGRLSFELLPGN